MHVLRPQPIFLDIWQWSLVRPFAEVFFFLICQMFRNPRQCWISSIPPRQNFYTGKRPWVGNSEHTYIPVLSCLFSGSVLLFCVIERVFSNPPPPNCGRNVLFDPITFIFLFAFCLLSHFNCLSTTSWWQEFSSMQCQKDWLPIFDCCGRNCCNSRNIKKIIITVMVIIIEVF